ncbi:hypothetical protein G7085_13915 [Tessaracoccus sp. HDW20]|uniref:hypothetical protein n=1 Tax=Tessaracoccus coleopterorum TaxID=2714950 RepID=UPI0018D3569F|nr:hypothetical protein [Tessaracoccus coleopterorum]NHB85345.1 hypothetical protein [Tessaracoccus coleopterorum]
MTTAPEPHGLIVCLPDASLDDHVAVIETLLQEGLSRFALPAGSGYLAEVVGIFGSRAVFGAYRVATGEEVRACAAVGVSFLLLDLADPGLIGHAAATGVPCFASAMTPAEIRGSSARVRPVPSSGRPTSSGTPSGIGSPRSAWATGWSRWVASGPTRRGVAQVRRAGGVYRGDSARRRLRRRIAEPVA